MGRRRRRIAAFGVKLGSGGSKETMINKNVNKSNLPKVRQGAAGVSKP